MTDPVGVGKAFLDVMAGDSHDRLPVSRSVTCLPGIDHTDWTEQLESRAAFVEALNKARLICHQRDFYRVELKEIPSLTDTIFMHHNRDGSAQTDVKVKLLYHSCVGFLTQRSIF